MPNTPTALPKLPLNYLQDAATYKTILDGNFAAAMRTAMMFAPAALPFPAMQMFVMPGHTFSGATLTEMGTMTTGTTAVSASLTITGPTAGIVAGMSILAISATTLNIVGNTHTSTTLDGISTGTTQAWVGAGITGSGIPANTTITAVGPSSVTLSAAATTTVTGVVALISTANPIPAGTTVSSIAGNVVTMSAAATAIVTGLQLIIGQLSGVITAPVGNPRIDRVVLNPLSGAVSVITGTAAASPAAPAITNGNLPLAQILLQTTSTNINNSMITDERDFTQIGEIGFGVPWIAAGGTSDAITATYAPAVVSLTDGLRLAWRSTAANTTATPTFTPNGLTPHTITRFGGQPLLPGDIPAANSEVEVRYNLANTRWELIDPAVPGIPWAVMGGTATAYTVTNTPTVQTLYDGLLVTARANAANTGAAPTLQVDATAAHPITKFGGQALTANDIAGNLVECIFRYNLANTRWELLNPKAGQPTITQAYDSGQLTITANATYTLAHGFGVKPKIIQVYVTCTTIDLQYAIGDESQVIVNHGGAGTASQFSIVPDATNLNVRIMNTIFMAFKGSTAASGLTFTAWKVSFRAYA